MFKLPPLPYAYEALEPTISSATMHVHHDKHHAKYIDTMNEMLEKAGAAPASLEEVIIGAASDPATRKLYNNAAQTWNHAFFWCCMKPAAAKPDGALADAIAAFGGLDKLKETFVAEGVGHFGSGWVWLTTQGGQLKVVSTHDGDNLLTQDGVVPLIVCDLWEHAYYLDYKNDRKGFLEAWFDSVADWGFAAAQLAAASGAGKPWRYEDA